MIHISEAIAKRISGKYGLYPGMKKGELINWLNTNGFERVPDWSLENSAIEYAGHRTYQLGPNNGRDDRSKPDATNWIGIGTNDSFHLLMFWFDREDRMYRSVFSHTRQSSNKKLTLDEAIEKLKTAAA
jgi:hypothetical protein